MAEDLTNPVSTIETLVNGCQLFQETAGRLQADIQELEQQVKALQLENRNLKVLVENNLAPTDATRWLDRLRLVRKAR